MAVTSGTCPSCGAPIEFGLGSSIAKVCEYCQATVVRGDRGLESLGKVAAIANTPSLVAVGDVAEIDGRRMDVVGRVRLDHGKGPWDEYYVAFDHGQSWGWLAYAEGHWLLTTQAQALPAPAFASVRLEESVALGGSEYRVSEIKTGRVIAAEGELPRALRPNELRHFIDLLGQNGAFATIDYGDNTGACEVFTGWVVEEARIHVTQGGPRTQAQVKTATLKCPNCGGDVPKLNGDRSKRMGCPYCGAISDVALQQVVAQQEAAMQSPDIPIGARGKFNDREYICIALVRRSALFDGERFGWDEYLLFSLGIGYRWLVKDEHTWMWASPINMADLDLASMPAAVTWGKRSFELRNRQEARVDYVLGEVYWQVEVGETVRAGDYANGREVLSREESPGEVRWSYSVPIPWPVIAKSLGVPENSAGGRFATAVGGEANQRVNGVVALVVLVILVLICFAMCSPGNTSSGGVVVFGGSGSYYGGK